MISQLSLQSDKRLLAVPSRQSDWRRMCWWAFLTVFTCQTSFQVRKAWLDLISQEKKLKRIEQTPNWKILPAFQSFQNKQPICIHVNLFSFEGSSLPLLPSLGSKWKCGTSVNGSFTQGLNTQIHQEVPPDQRKATAAMFLLLFPGLWAPAWQIPGRDVC